MLGGARLRLQQATYLGRAQPRLSYCGGTTGNKRHAERYRKQSCDARKATAKCATARMAIATRRAGLLFQVAQALPTQFLLGLKESQMLLHLLHSLRHFPHHLQRSASGKHLRLQHLAFCLRVDVELICLGGDLFYLPELRLVSKLPGLKIGLNRTSIHLPLCAVLCPLNS
eukprot:TRINITY_DN9810_c1_g1_i4.p1 TRINITY_DN9810_c1_g1~~TRINITY_DN9810_c1_g1_i4.p1  ORF type:complete len:171 (-),score=21.11 TRINITY_DN9810_c1_g1_i4:52-564(-)